MNKIVQALVALAALTIIATGAWLAISSWQAAREQAAMEQAEYQAFAIVAEAQKRQRAEAEAVAAAERIEAEKVAKGIARSECKLGLESLSQFGWPVRVGAPDGNGYLNADQCRALIAEQ